MNSVAAKTNIVFAIIINSVLFSLIHLGNPNVTILGMLNIILVAVFFSIYAIWRGNIWGAGAIHSAWNFTLSCVIGINISGISTPSIFTSDLSGSKLLTGGGFGFEGGVVLTILLLLLIIFLSYRMISQKKVVK